MEGDEKATIDIVGRMDGIHTKVVFKIDFKLNINSIHDKVMLQMLEDSANENDEPLRLIEKMIWDPKTKPAEFDVNDSTVLRLMYRKHPER